MSSFVRTWLEATLEKMPPNYMMKVDLHKAFDSVHLDFIKELLTALKFPPLFIQWVVKCTTSVQFIISVNGQQGDFLKGQRGLKEGDPLSYLLFVLSMEYLLRLLSKLP